jgi:DNA-binding response OmpR family regulator
MKILIVDDEELLVKGIRFNLQNDGYEVVSGSDGLQAVELARAGGIDLIVLDLMMPNMDGMEACRHIRQFSDVPIIMLTAKTDDIDKLMGFDCGADDYMTKPFNILELKARIRALLRRSAGTGTTTQSTSITIGPISIDTSRRSAHRDGVSVDLTAKEFEVVELLMRNPGRVFSRENLLDTIWGRDYQGDIRTVDVHMRRLREKLENDPAHPKYLMTKWGVGYYFND